MVKLVQVFPGAPKAFQVLVFHLNLMSYYCYFVVNFLSHFSKAIQNFSRVVFWLTFYYSVAAKLLFYTTTDKYLKFLHNFGSNKKPSLNWFHIIINVFSNRHSFTRIVFQFFLNFQNYCLIIFNAKQNINILAVVQFFHLLEIYQSIIGV